MIRKFLVTDPRKIVPKHSASLDRYMSIGIHADHMGMTKFLSDQDPNYRDVLSELSRFVQPYEEQMKAKLPLVTSVSPEIQGQSYRGLEMRVLRGRSEIRTPCVKRSRFSQQGRLTPFLAHTFYTNGAKMIQGSEFNSGGGSMTF